METLAVWHYQMHESVQDLAADYGLPPELIEDALAYHQAHREEIGALIDLDAEIEVFYRDKLDHTDDQEEISRLVEEVRVRFSGRILVHDEFLENMKRSASPAPPE